MGADVACSSPKSPQQSVGMRSIQCFGTSSSIEVLTARATETVLAGRLAIASEARGTYFKGFVEQYPMSLHSRESWFGPWNGADISGCWHDLQHWTVSSRSAGGPASPCIAQNQAFQGQASGVAPASL